MKSVYLTGFMGAGKTTIGKYLGEMMNFPVFDTDTEIEKAEHTTVADIFSTFGESYFRDLESEKLRDLPKEECIITTGGGIILREENRKWIDDHGYYVYLHCDPDVIAARLAGDESRPLLSGSKKAELHALFEARLPLYRQASIHIDTTGKTVDDTVNEIVRRIKLEEKKHTS